MEAGIVIIWGLIIIGVAYGLYAYRNHMVEEHNLHLFRSWAFACHLLAWIPLIFTSIKYPEYVDHVKVGMDYMSTDNMVVCYVLSVALFGLGVFSNAKRAPIFTAFWHSVLQIVFAPIVLIGGFIAVVFVVQTAQKIMAKD